MNKPEEQSIEFKIQRIQAILSQLQSGSLPLDELLKLYEEGIVLSKSAKHNLEQAKVRIRRVTESADENEEEWIGEIAAEIRDRLAQNSNKEELIQKLYKQIIEERPI